MITQKPAEAAKIAGLKSLEELSKITGQSTRTLQHWHKSKPKLFKCLLVGASILNNKIIIGDQEIE